MAAIEAGADDFIAKPFDQAELLARVRSLLRIKRYHDTIEAQAAELAAWNRELEQRVERAGRRARAHAAGCGASSRRSSPSSSSRRATSRSSRATAARSPSCSATCAASRLRRDRRARGRDGGARRVPRGARRSRPPLRGDARALHRRRADGLLQRPAAVPRRAASARSGWRVAMRSRVADARRGLAPAWATTSASASASRRATRRSAASASRAASTTRRSAPSRTSPRGCAPRRGRGQILISQRVYAAAEEHRGRPSSVGELDLRGFSRPARAYNVRRPRRGPDVGMSRTRRHPRRG